MGLIKIPEKKTLAELGFDNFGQAPLQFSGSEINQKALTIFEGGIPSNFIQDGDTIVRLTVVDGYLQSDDYVEGSAGWRITPKIAEFEDGYFRGDISASSGTFGNLSLNAAATPNAIVVNDGTNDRILIGYLEGKF